MPTDFERDLSELLHTVTPEPPDDLAPPRIATLAEATGAGAHGAAVIELVPGTELEPRQRRRWPTVLAAASVAALIAGVLAAIHVSNSGHPAAGKVTPTSTVAATPPCRSDDVVISDEPFTVHGRTTTGGFTYRNTGATPCTVVLTAVTIGAGQAGGTPFPGSAETVRIPADGKVVFTARVRVAGRCRTVKEGLRINVIEKSWTYGIGLGVAGCTLTPLRLTHRAVG
jgi:hypothetical protein